MTLHLAARMVRDRDHLDRLLADMAEIGVDDAFVIGGDAPHAHGDYSSAVELLPDIAAHPLRPQTLGIAAYPEGHPAIDERTLAEALERKAPLADYVTTQLCFEADPLLNWIRHARAHGLELPVIVGMPGVVDRRRLMEISMRIGVGPSLRFLRKQHGFFRRLLGRSGPAGEQAARPPRALPRRPDARHRRVPLLHVQQARGHLRVGARASRPRRVRRRHEPAPAEGGGCTR